MEQNLDKWLSEAPRIECDWEPLKTTYQAKPRRSRGASVFAVIAKGQSLPAAGLPWFMTMFGRDSIFTSLQAVPFTPELAATTLRVLGAWQGSRVDDFRDEDPGRILHEMRYGEMTAFEERPHSPYYGCADATALYVILLDEYERWTGDTKLVRELEYEARAALKLDRRLCAILWATAMSRTSAATKKPDSKIVLEGLMGFDLFPRWRLPGFPRATCEFQGYAYDAKMRGARLARLIWNDPAFAEKLEREAADLKRRFNRDFWVEDGEFFALALDAEASKSTHCLEHRTPALERNRRKIPRLRPSHAPDGTEALLRLGRTHAGRR